MLSIEYSHVSTFNSKKIYLFSLKNDSGACLQLLNYGATIVSVVMPDRNGVPGNVVLNLNSVDGYFSDKHYMGSTIGRFANRISNGRIMLDGKHYELDKNDGKHCNHGGYSGFNTMIMDFTIEGNNVIFHTTSSNGDSGFPGNVSIQISYTLSGSNEVIIDFKASSDTKTPLNFTNHAYFNLFPEGQNILDHELKVDSREYIEMNSEFLPTGKILPVSGTAFDFTEFKKISNLMQLKQEHIKGYNTYFIYSGSGAGLKRLASVREIYSGRTLDVYSTMPGVLIYTGDYLDGSHQPFGGLCLEAQYYPDAPNQPNFPDAIYDPDNSYHETIKYAFGTWRK
jgi:aldose 1-epimerase